MRSCVFDLDYSLYCLTLMRGGAHYALGDPGSPAIQILGTLETEEDQLWAALQLELILTGEGLAPDPEERRDILSTVRHMADPDVPVPMRTLSLARTLLPRNRLKVGLTPFCQGGEYAFCDGNADTLAWDKRLLCFEMAALKAMPRALGPVLAWCFHQLETRWFTGDPVRIIVDEAAGCSALARCLGRWSSGSKRAPKRRSRCGSRPRKWPTCTPPASGRRRWPRCPFACCCPMRRP